MSVNRRSFLGGVLLSSAVAVAGCGTSSGKRGAAEAGTPAPAVDWVAFADSLRRQAAAGQFSGAIRVEEGGKVLLDNAFGMADRDRNVPNAPATKYCAASMGKMFTAVAIGQLVSAGQLAFSDTVGRHLPGFPPAIADHVTVAQLLTHTSGLGDVLRPGPTPPPQTLPAQLALIAKTPPAFAPGSGYAYSNSGFIVLGGIVERVAGATYASYVHDHVFSAAGMTDTEIRVYRPVDVPGMAHGYALDGAAPGNGNGNAAGAPEGSTLHDISTELQIGNPSGGAITTTADMARFATALTANRLLSPAMTATMTTGKVPVQRPGDPGQDSYAYGFDDHRINGTRIIGHNGGTPGYEGQLDIYPDRGLTVVILTNQDRVLVPAIQQTEAMLTGAPARPAG